MKRAKESRLLKSSRRGAKLSQRDVAKNLGYTSAQFVSNWERGLSSPPVETLPKLCELYKCKPMPLINARLADLKAEMIEACK